MVSLSCTFFAEGQRARLFSTDAELTSSLIGDIYQDHQGIIWIATQDGINRYDGAKFTAYNQQNDGILHNYVRTIFEDRRHHLFFGFFNGLQKYDHATDTFSTVPLLLENEGEFAAHVLSMIERQDRTVLIGTSGHGLFSLTWENDQPVARQRTDLVPSYLTNYLFEDDRQNLWVATQDQGLFRVDQRGRRKNYFGPSSGLGNNITSICQDESGTVFINFSKFSSSVKKFYGVSPKDFAAQRFAEQRFAAQRSDTQP